MRPVAPDAALPGVAAPDVDSPPNSRWNFVVLTGDASAYFFAVAFVDATTVLPLFFQRAYESLARQHLHLLFLLRPALLTGAAIAIRSAGWFIPQFFSARTVSASRRKKPVLVLYCWIGRLPLLVVTLYLIGAAGSYPLGAVLLVMAAWIVFSFSEGFSGVPWTYIVSHAVEPRRRGRLFGGMQVISGVLAAGAGVLVNRILGPHGPPFPQNFAVLFGCMFVGTMVSQMFLLLIREPETSEEPECPQPMARYLRQLPSLMRHRAFRRMVWVQWLGSLAAMAAPLYILFATERLHIPTAVAGRYLSAAMVGTVMGSLTWGHLNDRFSPRLVIRLNLVAAAFSPWAALAVVELSYAGLISGPAVAWTYALSFFLNGVSYSGGWTGYTNYVLEAVPAARRAEYIGLMNTLNAPVVIMPLIGTWLAGVTSTPLVYFLAGIGCLLAFLMSRSLPREPETG